MTLSAAQKSHPRLSTDLEVWLADLTYTQAQVAAELVPYAVGGIATYAETLIDFAQRIRLFKYPEALAKALEEDGPPDIIGFSNYCWNGNLACAFARRIKELRTETIVVLGGPNYPVTEEEQIAYLRDHPEVDFHVYKEGEQAFAALLRSLIENDMDKEAAKGKVPSVHTLSKDGTAHLDTSMPRIKDLSVIPSPYLDGRMDEFFDGILLPIIQFRRGCPFTCLFCSEGEKYFNKINSNTVEKSEAELEYIKNKMLEIKDKGGRWDLFIGDSNFGMYKEDVEIAKKIGAMRKAVAYPDYVHVATGKNQKKRVLEVANALGGALRLSGSVQTLDPTTLKNIKRANIDSSELLDLAMRAAELDANSYSELIIGLPGETKQSHYESLRAVMAAGFTRVIVYQLWVLPGTELASLETQRKFGMDLRYRVLTRCFGDYPVAGKQLTVAEIDQICVATDTLSFEDYQECRVMHFMINMFYNDAVFGTVLKLLKALDVSCFRWMELLMEIEPAGPLKENLDKFRKATREELWDNKEDLKAFINKPGVIDGYLKGDYGYHLMFTHKAIAMAFHTRDLEALAADAAERLLREAGKDTPDNLAFMNDALAYDAAAMTGIWRDRDQDVSTVLRFDVKKFASESKTGALSTYKLPEPRRYKFVLDAAQLDSIERNLAVWGDDIQGVVRILSKAYIKKFLRGPVRVEKASS